MQAYYRQPAIYRNHVVFVCEDDLWTFDLNNPIARRLTANLGMIRSPQISPDGKFIAFTSNEEGHDEVFIIPFAGGEAKRLTWLGANATALGWKDGKIIFTANHAQPFMNYFRIFELDPQGGNPVELPYGRANAIAFGEKGVVLGRNVSNPARWKRYKGGTAGHLLIDRNNSGKFAKFIKLNGNFASPMWIGKRIYFLCDHEGIGNLYSCTSDGKDLQKHSNHQDYYARNAYTDGVSIIWAAGADIYLLNVAENKPCKVEFSYASPMVQRQRKFVDATKHMEDVYLSKDGGSFALTVRGKAYVAGNWEGSAQQYGTRHGIRYRLAQIMPDAQSLMLVSDEPGYERFEIHPLRKEFEPVKAKVKTFADPDLGRVYGYKLAPDGKKAAMENYRNELIVLDLESGSFTTITRNKYGMIGGYNWSPDSRWLAYSTNINRKTMHVCIWDSSNGEIHNVTKPVLEDYNPAFDPEGKYLYFLSIRTFNPMGDSIQFDFSYPNSVKPYLIPLRKDLRSPFIAEAKAFEPKPETPQKDEKEKAETSTEEIKPVEIEFDGITERLVEFPVAAGYYFGLRAIAGRVYYGNLTMDNRLASEQKADLECYDFNKLEGWTYVHGIMGYALSGDGTAMMLIQKDSLRVISAKLEPKAELPSETAPGKKSGFIDLNRFKPEIIPVEEWKQMFREAWRLQKQNYWVEDMAGIDWQKVFDRYYPLVERCACRSDFSDLMWEMQGELGTSHCYEFGGDYRPSPSYRIGKLGVDWQFNARKKGYEITKILRGDHWEGENRSPLMNPGLGIDKGWILTSINGQPLSKHDSPEKLTLNLAGQQVQLELKSPDGKQHKVVSVHTMKYESSARYRDWVEGNREYVHSASKGKLGYLHIPNMGQEGLREFHRYFLAEVDYEGLVIDVRNNGGGSVSGLLLQKLARKRIGYDLTRWWGANPYMDDAPMGPMVCLTDEYAGSDGDIFSHSFKLLGLGKLIGKRTWGGVIGIWPRHWLVDGTITTQPEFSFWFKDVGWGVENYGTDPDIEVEIMPQDIVAGKDPQLDMGIKTALAEIKKNPPLKPDFSNIPRRTLPKD
ncbi:MAG: PDZ domain-containing protein [Candidatus Cloacimonas sp.]|jgi:tricorn protease|nr:PDZ domain-containing protein [Candidatus Cloacimonas sp.]